VIDKRVLNNAIQPAHEQEQVPGKYL